MSDYGFVHNQIDDSASITVQVSPLYFGEGYRGSMRHLLIISLLVSILLIINYKYDNNKLMNRIVFLSVYGLILLVFDETLVRLTGAVILSISVRSYLKQKSLK